MNNKFKVVLAIATLIIFALAIEVGCSPRHATVNPPVAPAARVPIVICVVSVLPPCDQSVVYPCRPDPAGILAGPENQIQFGILNKTTNQCQIVGPTGAIP